MKNKITLFFLILSIFTTLSMDKQKQENKQEKKIQQDSHLLITKTEKNEDWKSTIRDMLITIACARAK